MAMHFYGVGEVVEPYPSLTLIEGGGNIPPEKEEFSRWKQITAGIAFVAVLTTPFVFKSGRETIRAQEREEVESVIPVSANYYAQAVDLEEAWYIEQARQAEEAAAEAARSEAERIEAERIAQEQAAAVAYARQQVNQSGPRPSNGGSTEDFLACTRGYESDSSGGYGAVSPSGTYRGAYQFNQPTWDGAVARAGYEEYVGVPAEQVPPEVQDAAAIQLYGERGNQPWGGRC